MTCSFESACSKTERAYHQLKTLEAKVGPFFADNPYPIRHEFNAECTECRFYISVTKPLPQREWGLIIGDCIHNARSALDHLIWELSEIFSGPAPTDTDTQFPIYDAPHPTMPFSLRAERRIKRLPVYAQALVEQLQPYRAPNIMEHPLWLCRHLDDIDKHKLIPVVIGVVNEPGFSWSGPLDFEIAKVLTGPFEDGTEIGFVRFRTPISPSEVQMHSYFTVVEALSESAPRYVRSRHTLRRILHHVTRIIDVFEAFPDHHGLLRLP